MFLKFKSVLILLFLVLFPGINFAQADTQECSSRGYSVITINGVFTDENEARTDKKNLDDLLPPTFKKQPVKVDYLFNPSHLAGVGDLLASAYQKYFDERAVNDYDLLEMIKDASQKVETQKLLLVAYSQGNFYANSFYDTVADQEGGVPKQSLGVYAIATPSKRLVGERWITSDTDRVISGLNHALDIVE